MRFPSVTGAGLLAAAALLVPQMATAQQYGNQPGQQQFGAQQGIASSQQPQGKGVPLYVSPREVRLIQRRLARLGLNPGPVDGRWQPQTQQALAEFQQGAGLSPTGNINLATFHALRSMRAPGGQFLGIGEQPSGTGLQQQRQGAMGLGGQRSGTGWQR